VSLRAWRSLIVVNIGTTAKATPVAMSDMTMTTIMISTSVMP
jgi:hypothetical protein